MQWRRVDPVQPLAALIAIGDAAVDAMAAAMSRKSPLLQSLAVEHGDGWAAIFASAVPGEADPVLPRLGDVTPLYEAAPRVWLPVGVAMAVPDHARGALMQTMFDHYEAAPPAIVVPRFAGPATRSGEADLYLIRDPVAFRRSALCIAA